MRYSDKYQIAPNWIRVSSYIGKAIRFVKRSNNPAWFIKYHITVFNIYMLNHVVSTRQQQGFTPRTSKGKQCLKASPMLMLL